MPSGSLIFENVTVKYDSLRFQPRRSIGLYPPLLAQCGSDFLGRVNISTAMLLHPPRGGSKDLITMPLLALSHAEHVRRCAEAIDDDSDAEIGNVHGADTPEGTPESPAGHICATNSTVAPHLEDASQDYKATGRFASCVFENAHNGITEQDEVTGTLSFSLEKLGDIHEGTDKRSIRRSREEIPSQSDLLRRQEGYRLVKLKVIEDIVETKQQRDRECIQVSNILSEVEMLHHKLAGAYAARQDRPPCPWSSWVQFSFTGVKETKQLY